MDARLVILGIILVVLLIAFGNNPGEHKVDASQDPFQKSLEDKLESNKKAMATMPGGVENGGGFMQGATGNPYAHPTVGGGGVAGGGMRLPGVTATIPAPATPAQAAAQPKPAAPEPVASPQAPAFFLRDGRRVFFSGYEVFTMGADGNLAPLPDGEYALQSGDKITVRDGQRVGE